MVRPSEYGDKDPYSWWHRDGIKAKAPEIADELKIIDADNIVTSEGQTKMKTWIEFADDIGIDICAFIETINLRNGIDDINDAPNVESIWSHKRRVLKELARAVDWPVFVVWVSFDMIDEVNGKINCAIPDGFYVRQMPNEGECSMDVDEYIDFLHVLRNDFDGLKAWQKSTPKIE